MNDTDQNAQGEPSKAPDPHDPPGNDAVAVAVQIGMRHKAGSVPSIEWMDGLIQTAIDRAFAPLREQMSRMVPFTSGAEEIAKQRDDYRERFHETQQRWFTEQKTSDALRAELAQAKRDSERLTWVEANPEAVKAQSIFKSSFGRKVWWTTGRGDYDTAREAIDSAMAAEKEGKA